jgi:hypothetical protein
VRESLNCLAVQKSEAHSSTEKQLREGDDGDQVTGVQVEGVNVMTEE